MTLIPTLLTWCIIALCCARHISVSTAPMPAQLAFHAYSYIVAGLAVGVRIQAFIKTIVLVLD